MGGVDIGRRRPLRTDPPRGGSDLVGRFLGNDHRKMLTEEFRERGLKTKVVSAETRDKHRASFIERDLKGLLDELRSETPE